MTRADIRRREASRLGVATGLGLTLLALGLPAHARRVQQRPEVGVATTPAGDRNEPAWSTVSLESLGMGETMRRYHARPTVTLPFAVRANHVLVAARLRLRFEAPPRGVAPLGPLEVLVNGELVTTLEPAAAGEAEEVVVALNAAVIDDENTLVLRQVARDACRRVEAGSWRQIADGGLELQSRPLPLPDDLALLPLPFVDPRLGDEEALALVLLAARTPETVRAAGFVAAYFGLEAGSALGFEVHFDELPDRSAVVLASGREQLAAVGLEPVDGPTLRMVSHPHLPGNTRKLLVVAGRDAAELVTAARGLTLTAGALSGAAVAVASLPPPEPSRPYDAPRWVGASGPVRLGAITGGRGLTHEEQAGSSMEVSFRLAPDLFAWPDSQVDLELRYAVNAPPEAPPPRLLVEINGHFLGRLPAGPRASRGATQTAHLTVHRTHLRGFNRLVVHAESGAAGEGCTATPAAARVVIAPDSVLHLRGLPHFAPLADVGLFVHDGFPFSRIADLGDTAVILPDHPSSVELGLALSVLSQVAAITGTPPHRARYLTVGQIESLAHLDKDLLVIAGRGRHALLDRWDEHLPFERTEGGPRPRRPATAAAMLRFLSGWGVMQEQARARVFVERGRTSLVVAGIASPLSPGRNAVVIMATAAERANTRGGGEDEARAPSLRDAMGFAEATYPRGDLLLVTAGHRGMFWLGESHGRGELPPWIRVRWYLATHWLLLLPLLLLPGLLLAPVARRRLERRARRRLGDPEEGP